MQPHAGATVKVNQQAVELREAHKVDQEVLQVAGT